MIIRIDQTSPEPVYLQIRNQIVAVIRARGTRSIRQAAQRTRAGKRPGANLHTVNKAYAVLRDEGFLMMRGRAGAVIADFRHTASPEHQAAGAEKIEEALYRLALEHRAQGGGCKSFLAIASEQAKRVFDAAVSDTSTEERDRRGRRRNRGHVHPDDSFRGPAAPSLRISCAAMNASQPPYLPPRRWTGLCVLKKRYAAAMVAFTIACTALSAGAGLRTFLETRRSARCSDASP